MFQSTHPHGVRLKMTIFVENAITVSIHAPARGATSHFLTGHSLQIKFQSTHPHGVRLLGHRHLVTG